MRHIVRGHIERGNIERGYLREERGGGRKMTARLLARACALGRRRVRSAFCLLHRVPLAGKFRRTVFSMAAKLVGVFVSPAGIRRRDVS